VGEADGGCLSFRGSNNELDKPGLSRCWVPGEDVVAGSQLIIDKLVQGDRAVREISLGQARALLQQPQTLRRLWDQGNRDAITR
jgi:hypothetical protein